MSELQKFLDELMADVVAEAANASTNVHPDAAFKENAFARILLNDLEAAGIVESPTACYFANTSAKTPSKVNAYCIPDEEARLDIVIADFRSEDTVQKITVADIDRSFKLALRFLSVAVNEGPTAADGGHEEQAMLREIYERQVGFEQVRLILITNALAPRGKEKVRLETTGRYKISYDIWDIERLRRFRSSGATHEPINVDFQKLSGGGIRCVPVSDDALGYETCVAILPGQVLYELYEEHGARLLELNVRSYLQAKGKINKEILETLLLKPHQFLAYNNGITIVVERLQYDHGGTMIAAAHGLQIVNGGQTTASIHRARKENSSDLSHVFVQAKFTVVPAEEFDVMVPEISRLSNTQNKVSTVDLGANHTFHIGVERVSRKIWAPGEQSMWFYERARGAFQTERLRHGTTSAKRVVFERKFPVSQRITKEDLARYSNTWDGLPHVVSRGGQKNFVRFMNGLKQVEKGWEPSLDEFKALVGKAILFLKTQQAARSLGIKAFAINIVTYTVALLAERTSRRIDLGAIWSSQGLSVALQEQVEDWLPRVANELLMSAGDRNPGEWFKSEQCWQELKASSSTWQLSLRVAESLTSVGREYDDASHDVQSNVARCIQIDAKKWFEIQLWGGESHKLQAWQIGIANTLAGYAAQGWIRKPSVKQAKYAVAIIELYEQAHPVN